MTQAPQNARAVVFEAPQQLSVRSLELKPFEPAVLAVEVSFSGISTGTERLLWDGTMPPFPGLGYPLGPGCETVGRVVRVGDAAAGQVGEHVFIPGALSVIQRVRAHRRADGGSLSWSVAFADHEPALHSAPSPRCFARVPG